MLAFKMAGRIRCVLLVSNSLKPSAGEVFNLNCFRCIPANTLLHAKDSSSSRNVFNLFSGPSHVRRFCSPPAEISLQKFFERAGAIENIVGLLKQMEWGEELQTALSKLAVTYDTPLVTQILRVDISCDMALSFFNWLKSRDGFKHNEYTYGVMINALGRVGRVNEMQELFEEMKSEGCKMTSVSLSGIMLWLSKAEDYRGAVRHWEKLRRAGNKPSVAIYTAYLDLLVRAKRYTKIDNIFKEMLKEECLPNSRTYTLFIQHLVSARKLEAATKILDIMQNIKVVPNRVTYECIIIGFAKARNAEMILKLLNEMREHFHRPSKQLMPAIKVLQDAGMVDEAVTLGTDIWPDLPINDISDLPLNNEEVDAGDDTSLSDCLMSEWRSVTCSHVGFDVNAFSQALCSWNLQVEETLEQANVEWQSSLVLEVLRRLRNLETSWPFFHWLKGKVGFKHDSYSCMLMIQRILKSECPVMKKASLLEELFEGMQKDGLTFSVPMFNIIIRYYVEIGEAEKAVDMFNYIKRFHLEPNEASYAAVIQGLAKNRQGRKAMEMLEAMEEAGFKLDGITCSELINCLGLAGKTERAFSLFRRMSETGRGPGPREYKAIMAMYSRLGDQKMALTLYEEMRGTGIAPSQDMFEVLRVILHKANRSIDIQAIAERRMSLSFFGGKKKALQEKVLEILSLFTENIKPRKIISVAGG